jgi:hypothetical protein
MTDEPNHLESNPDAFEEPNSNQPLPEALAKAIADPFQYALMLRDGTITEFEGADVPSSGWVLLHGPRIVNRGYDASFDRGVEIRLEEVVWVADAPHDS